MLSSAKEYPRPVKIAALIELTFCCPTVADPLIFDRLGTAFGGDAMTTQWFRARAYGWGWTPVSIEGWLVVAGFLVAVLVSALILANRVRAGADARTATVIFVLWLGVLVAALIATCWATGERPGWHWGSTP
jgi:hypothetical protein